MEALGMMEKEFSTNIPCLFGQPNIGQYSVMLLD